MENKTKYIIIAAVALVLIIAIVIAVMVTKSKENDDTLSDETYANEESGNHEPVSASDDVTVSFENMTTGMAEEFEEHDIITTLTTALHSEATTLENIITADKTTIRNPENTTNRSPENTTAKTEKPTSSSAEKTTAQHYVEQTTEKTGNNAIASDDVMRIINSFFKGKYYFDGTMVADGAQSAMEIAMDGNNYIVYSEMDGMDLGVLSLDGEFYLINPSAKKYTVLSKTLQNMMDLDMDSLKMDFNAGAFNGFQPTEVTEARYNGKSAVCYTYKNSQHHYDFVVVNGEIIQMVQYNSSGKAATVLHFDEFSADFDKNMVSIKDYKKTNILSFVKDMMG